MNKLLLSSLDRSDSGSVPIEGEERKKERKKELSYTLPFRSPHSSLFTAELGR